ncbi:SCO family protein [Aquirufa beregesia]|nr:SCO family protein [Aquirufa beregesia]
MGHKDTVVKNGKVDTVYHQIPSFQFLNQDSTWVSDKNYEGKIYVADFFFTSCPTICPKMKTQMLRLYERYAHENQLALLSFSIDPDFDRPHVLKAYASRLQVQSPKWNMVTGEKAKIYELGQKSFMVTAQEDKNEAGGFVHSGAFILVDKQRHVRGIYDGTQEQEVNHLMEDIELLLKEK